VIFGPIKLVFKAISLVLTALVLYFAITFVQVWLSGHDHATNRAGAILVFGTAELDGHPSAELQDRLKVALWLFDQHRAPLIAVTGGKRPGDSTTEALVSASYLEAHGVPANDIVIGGGADTWQNVASVAGKLKHDGVKSVLTVTDPFHEYRAMAISSNQGLKPYGYAVTHSAITGTALWGYYAKETFEVGVARVVGYHDLSNWLHG
jgi:uncharacterized SAM-binding protein YcdF (DUF218 family)